MLLGAVAHASHDLSVLYLNAEATAVFPTPGYPLKTMNGAAAIFEIYVDARSS